MRTAVLSTQAAADAFKALKKIQIMHQILKKLSLFKQKDNQLLKNFKKNLKPYLKTNSKNAERYSGQRKRSRILSWKIQQAQEETAQRSICRKWSSMQKIIGELIQAKQIKVLLQKNESILFSDPAMDLTDDVTSMLDVAASEASTQSE